MNEKTLYPRLANYLWSTEHNQGSKSHQYGIQILRYLYVITDDITQGDLTLRAMSLVYTTLLSMVPVIAVSFAVLKAFGVHNDKLMPLLLQFMEPMGEKGVEITNKIVGFIDQVDFGLLGIVGIIAVIYTAVGLIQKIEQCFNYVWRVENLRSFGQRFAAYTLLIGGGALMMFTALGLASTVLSGVWVAKAAEWIPFVAVLVDWATRLIPVCLIIGTFSFFYMYVPNTKVSVKSGVIAGIISGIIWQLVGWAFGSFVVNSPGSANAVIFSSMAILIFFMMWLYIGWLILLVGGSIAFYVQHPEYVVPTRRTGSMSNEQKENLALQIMTLMAKRHYTSKRPYSINQYVDKLGMQIQGISQVLDILLKSKFIAKLEGNEARYVPNKPLEETSVYDLMKAVRQSHAMSNVYAKESEVATVAVTIQDQIDKASEDALGKMTLKELAEQ